MSKTRKTYLTFGAAITLIVVVMAYMAYLGAQESKSYYVTVKELHAGNSSKFYHKHLRLVGDVQPGSIHQMGAGADFILVDKGETQRVVYKGTEPPPDTFKDNAQALAVGEFKEDGIFHANEVQAKCASKYAPKQPGEAPAQPNQPQAKGY